MCNTIQTKKKENDVMDKEKNENDIIENEKKFGEFKYMMFYNSLLELLKKIDCPEDLINIIMNSVNNVHAEVEEKFPTAKAARTCGNQMLEDVVDEIVFNVLTKNSYKE